MDRVFKDKSLTEEQHIWIDYIKEFQIQNLTIEEQDLKDAPIFERHGGLAKCKKVFKTDYKSLIQQINTAIAA